MFQGLVLLVDDEPIAAEDSMAALKQFVRRSRFCTRQAPTRRSDCWIPDR